MPSIVTITAANPSVEVKPGAKALQSFTVTNGTGGPLRVGRRMLADPPADAAWFRPLGPEEIDLAAGAAQRIDVEVAPAKSAPPGRYAFRPVVFSLARPGDDFTEGGSTTLDIPAEANGGGRAWGKIALILAGVLVLLGGGAGAAWWAFRDTAPPMPDFRRQLRTDVEPALKAQGLAVQVIDVDRRDDPSGTILDQKPLPGEPTPASGGTVELSVARQMVLVPMIAAKTPLATVMSALEAAKLRAATVEVDADTRVGGEVVRVVESGTEVPAGSAVTVEVASADVDVPALNGKLLDAALSERLNVKFEVAPVCRQDAARPENTIVDQFPAPGRRPRGTPLRVEYTQPGVCFVVLLPGIVNRLRAIGDLRVAPNP